jgi:hypothetical protein
MSIPIATAQCYTPPEDHVRPPCTCGPHLRGCPACLAWTRLHQMGRTQPQEERQDIQRAKALAEAREAVRQAQAHCKATERAFKRGKATLGQYLTTQRHVRNAVRRLRTKEQKG